MATRRDDGPFSAPPVDDNDGYEILESVDLLDEGELILEDGETDDGFEEEATSVYRPDEHGSLDREGDLADALPPVDDDEATMVRSIDEIEQEQRTTVRPSSGAISGGVSDVAPARNVDPWDEEATVVTDHDALSDPPPRIPVTSGPVIAVPAPRPPERRGPGALPIILVALLGGALALLAYVALQINRSPEPTSTPETSATTTLAVFSSPRGATVLLDGMPHDLPTPTTLRGLEPGETYEIAIELDGFETIRDSVTPSGTEPMQRAYELVPVTGSLVLSTVPPGAQLMIDAEAVGASPTRVDELDRSRTYVVTASLDGHEDETRLVRWAADAPREQTVTLQLRPADLPEPDPDAGLVSDAVADQAPPQTERAPAAAATPEPTRRDEPPAPAREPEPEPERPSQRPSERTEPAPEPTRPSQRPSERVQPTEPAPEPTGTGTLSVQAVPYGQVWIDDRMVASETPLLNYELSVGVHRVKVYFAPLSQFSEERAIRVEPGSARTVTFRAAR